MKRVLGVLPDLSGEPAVVELLPELSVSRGQLLSAASRGKVVYAASFIIERRIVLDLCLLETPNLLRAILLHEVFHFVWVRLGNPLRESFANLLIQERAGCARGHLGESSGLAKVSCKACNVPGSRPWRHYVCETFCDTAAYLVCGSSAGEGHRRIGKSWLALRRTWFTNAAANGWKF